MTRRTTRRTLLGGAMLAAAGAIAAPSTGVARNYPSRPITLVLPVSVGGSTDALMRLAAPHVSRIVGQQVLVDSRPGAAGAVAANIVARAKPDGHTLLAYFGSNLMLPYVQQVNFDPLKDFSLIVGQHTFASAAIVRSDSPYKTLGDLVVAAKAAPGRISIGTAGITSAGHLTIARFARTLSVDFLHVPYKGAEYNQALLGGHVDAVFTGPNWMAMVDGGQARALAIFDTARAEQFPDVPTAADGGVAIVERNSVSIAGPAGLSAEIIAILQDAFDAAHRSDEFQALLKRSLCRFWSPSGDALRSWAVEKQAADAEIAKQLGLKA